MKFQMIWFEPGNKGKFLGEADVALTEDQMRQIFGLKPEDWPGFTYNVSEAVVDIYLEAYADPAEEMTSQTLL